MYIGIYESKMLLMTRTLTVVVTIEFQEAGITFAASGRT